MNPPLTDASREFWMYVTSKKKQYPFWCKTGDRLPRPELISGTRYKPFIRVPFAAHAYWGFTSSEKRNTFATVYNAEDWSPR